LNDAYRTSRVLFVVVIVCFRKAKRVVATNQRCFKTVFVEEIELTSRETLMNISFNSCRKMRFIKRFAFEIVE
jgi:hypothetical protein